MEYKVVIELIEVYSGYVEADSEAEAERKALAMHADGKLDINYDSMKVTVESEE